ncbi:hypothetical protein IQ235_14425 [Oscillatoriales cyanobacterium LEGE 11467]|uniref:Anti-sigma factor n=1 Tax=Zarconia navalis LEGE 11467 TaxID=1828826 RepID=A0A928W2D0_9CYAN|nr:hypothetical protein [Zarconia navalis]MBE9041975.1 hypothetical protein [Zarconia navalis LEGE 11467]
MTSQFHNFFNSNSSSANKLDRNESAPEDDLLLLEDLEDAETEERFVLVSTYLDGEASPQECRQVEALLASDPKMRQLYNRMLTLRRGLRDIPVPKNDRPLEPMVDRVFATIDLQTQRKWRWGSGAVAALFLAVVSGFAFSTQSYNTQLAQISIEPEQVRATISPEGFNGEIPNSESPLLSKALFVE